MAIPEDTSGLYVIDERSNDYSYTDQNPALRDDPADLGYAYDDGSYDPPADPYPHQNSPEVAYGTGKNHQVLWAESQWNLEGGLSIDPDLGLTPGTVISLKGLGNNLSGSWWVSTVTHTIDASGYTMSATVMRNATGDTKPKEETPGQREDQATLPTDSKTYTVVSGDSLWSIANRFYGDGSQFSKIADANSLSSPYTITAGQVLTIP